MEEAATSSLYRGVTLHWYRLVRADGSVSYATAWQIGGVWQQGPCRADLSQAIDAAQRRMDRTLATQPASHRRR